MIKIFETNEDYNIYTLNNTSLISDILYYVKEDNSGHFYTNNIEGGECKIYDLGGSSEADDRVVAIFRKVSGQGSDGIFGLYADSYISEIEIDGVKQETIQQYPTLSQGNHIIKYKLNNNVYLPENMFSGCTDLISVILPSTIKTINNQAFANCEKLTSININNNVGEITYFGRKSFNYCKLLASIIIETVTPPALVNDIFDSSYVPKIYVPAESVQAYKSASIWSNYASNIEAIP